MKRHPGVLWIGILIASFALTGCATPKTHSAVTPVSREEAWWVQRHESFNQRAQAGDVDLIFIGDSITHSWENAGKEVWAKYYGHRKAMNLGISGDRTEHVLWRLDHGNIEGISPKAAVVMIGTNNTGHKTSTADEIVDGITAIVRKLRVKLPRTKILLLGIFPRSEKPDAFRAQNDRVNARISQLADGRMIHYMDIGVHFLQPDGTITKDIMPDYLHLTPWGYQIWAIAIEGKLRELLGEAP
jgi:beta-glucosidase